MISWLLFLLKSTLIFSLLYLFFRLLMREETFFVASRITLLIIVLASVIIPFVSMPVFVQPVIKIDPIFQDRTNFEKPVQVKETSAAIFSSEPASVAIQPVVISTGTILLIVYLGGVFISFLLLIIRLDSVLRLFKKSRKTYLNGILIMIVNEDTPAFSFMRNILISQTDYETDSEAILTHEFAHVRNGHFYDLIMMELVKVIYWFNPLVYSLENDLKEIHEFQADEYALHSGLDAIEYQLLIIQKCVGHQKFALANSFNHCQIKNRITMMNKSKIHKAWRWKVATFLPLLALLLMAFGKRTEIVAQNSSQPESVVAPSELVMKQYEQFKRKIEIKKDGNYMDNKLSSLEEIAKKGKEWFKTGNDWIFLLIDESVPLSRVDEVREALDNRYWVVQATVNSDDLVYFSGDVTESARFKQGKFGDWINNQLNNYPDVKSFSQKYALSYSFIIGKDGKVRDAHIIEKSDYPDVNAAWEKILTQIPEWEPAKRSGANVSVYYANATEHIIFVKKVNKE